MLIDNVVLENSKILSMLSKTESLSCCVFIQPNGIVEPDNVIFDLKLSCTEDDLMMENIILEIYDNEKEAYNRIMQFRGEWLDYFYVSYYKNGKFLGENT